MEKNYADERWMLANSTYNAVELCEVQEEEEEEEALSLSDLPLIHQSKKEREEEEEEESSPLTKNKTHQDDFDFCSLSQEPEMCAADEIFFQGQILPLRHSISSEKGSLLFQHSDSRRRPISRSESMDHYYSSRLVSSRSSSISSHQSSTSSSSATTTTTTAAATKYNPKLPPRRHSHSHPSPSPRLHFPKTTTNQRVNNSVKKSSSIWQSLRLGLVATPPEIAFRDLKTRNSGNNSKNFGSRNSTSSNCSSAGNSKKKKAMAFLGGCKCTADAVASRVVIIKRSASESDVEEMQQLRRENKNSDDQIKPAAAGKKAEAAAKKQLSHHRTFEWLKQLSVEGAADHEA